METTPVPVWVVEKMHSFIVTVAGMEIKIDSEKLSRELIANMLCLRLGLKHYGIMYINGKCELKDVLE